MGTLTSVSASLPVPASPADVTPQWLREALGQPFANMAFDTVEATRIGGGYGLASQIVSCRWSVDGATHSVVVKLWHTESVAGVNEVLFYRTFGRTLGARIPACLHAALDSDNKRGVLILEELDTLIQGDCLQQLPREQAAAVARSLAHVHATWLQHPALRQAAWLPSVVCWERDATWLESRRTQFLERFGDRLDDFALRLLNRIEQAPPIANERLSRAPTTLLHADFHLDNIVFEGERQPVILDWARCAKGPAALDLIELLFEMSRMEDVEVVLATYLDTFEQCTGEGLNAAEVRHHLGGALLRKFANATCGVARWQPATAREAAMIDVSIERACQAVRRWATHDPSLFAFLHQDQST